MLCFSSSTTIDETFAGASAPMTNCAGSSDHSTMSTFSPPSSLRTACTREPRMPTQVPIGSMPAVGREHRDLGAHAGVARRGLDLEQPLLDLGHLELEQLDDEFGRDARQQQLRPAQLAVDAQHVRAHAVADAQVLLRDHLVATQPRLDAARLDDRVAACSIRLTLPVTIDSPRARKSVRICSRSASRIFCRIICFVSCAKTAAELGRLELLLDVLVELDVADLLARLG